MFRLVAFLLTAIALHAQSIRYEVPQKAWDKNLGTHRVVVKVDAPAQAVRAHLEWRRRDPQPEKHGIVVTDAAGVRVMNALAPTITNEAGDVVFQAAAAGEYFVYFLPGAPGSGSFPVAKYLGPQDTGAAEWKAALGDVNKLPAANVGRWEARTEHDRFNEMEIIATKAEKDAWLAKNPGDVHVFLESRERPVRMFDQVPELWLKREKPPEFVARPGEIFFFQVGVWAPHDDRRVKGVMGYLPGIGNSRTPHELPVGRAEAVGPAKTVKAGTVQPFWCYFEVPTNAKQGIHSGEINLIGDGDENSGGFPEQTLSFQLTVDGEPLPDGGDSESWKHTKLRWLTSSLGKNRTTPKLLAALQIKGTTISCLGRTVSLGANGLPASIVTTFDASNGRTDSAPREILAAPMRILFELSEEGTVSFEPIRKLTRVQQSDDAATWSVSSIEPWGWIRVTGRMESDGHMEFGIDCENNARQVRLEIPRTADTCKYSTGLGYYGGAARLPVDWKWDVSKHQDAHWMGDVNAGLRVRLTAENYVRPMINIHYPRQPLNLPPSWGTGGIKVERKDAQTVLFTAYSGPRTLEPGKPLHFNFDLSITPFKPLDTAAQWRADTSTAAVRKTRRRSKRAAATSSTSTKATSGIPTSTTRSSPPTNSATTPKKSTPPGCA